MLDISTPARSLPELANFFADRAADMHQDAVESLAKGFKRFAVASQASAAHFSRRALECRLALLGSRLGAE